MRPGTRHFALNLDSLRAIGGWAADCAERALPLFEARAGSDPRTRAAIEGIREFAGGGRRAARLRSLAMAANAAAREAGDPAAVAAARAAGLAAASAYTHPLADVHQTKHIVGPAAYAALALELARGGDPRVGDSEIRRAIRRAPPEASEVLRHMPARPAGKSRLEALLHKLDAGIRAGPARRPDPLTRPAGARNLPGGAPESAPPPEGVTTMANRTNKKPAKTSRKAARPVLLAGGNPQIAKADGDAPVQAYIAAMPGWKRDVGRRLDALIMRHTPDARKAVRWNSPFYGIEGRGWFLGFHVFTRYIKVSFFRGASLRPLPPGGTERSGDARWIDIHEDDLDEVQLAKWIRQAAALPGWGKV